MGIILLFYKYISIEYPKRLLKWQQKICTDLGLKGRIILGHEGINGTVGGSTENIQRYKTIMHAHELFTDIIFKESEGSADHFPQLSIVVRDEIVRLGISPEIISAQNAGVHLKPSDSHNLITSNPDDLLILDARNKVESDVGAFEGAIKPPIKHFRELPAFIDAHKDIFKDKQVLMYCTGGIRCERASSYIKQITQAKEVYQMEGGIHSYVEQYPEGYFRGKNYVFDGRIAVRINADILGHCLLCNTSCDDYTNCINALCNKHFICCQACMTNYNNTCSSICQNLVIHKQTTLRPPIKIENAISNHSEKK
ncbi:MAG TPA: rhodanese-related sulfurtransferase [Candidatus Babeliales bacterium]|jgi:predicted sulfurtransferase|nr:rhodanese-related sulfurtransferase [Candidatus Babeliales bacterium]